MDVLKTKKSPLHTANLFKIPLYRYTNMIYATSLYIYLTRFLCTIFFLPPTYCKPASCIIYNIILSLREYRFFGPLSLSLSALRSPSPRVAHTHITAGYGRVGPRAPATQPAHGSQGRNSSLAPRTGPAGLWPSDIWRFPRVLIRFAMPAAKSLVRFPSLSHPITVFPLPPSPFPSISL